jgi:hypothetical protein
MFRAIAFAVCLSVSAATLLGQDQRKSIPIKNPGPEFKLVGQLGEELGTSLDLVGIIFDSPTKGDIGASQILVQKLGDTMTQEVIKIPLPESFDDRKALATKRNHGTFRLRGYESGEFTGIPDQAYKEIGRDMARRGFGFENYFVITRLEKIEPVEWSPRDFVDRPALLFGTAKNDGQTATIHGNGWKVLVPGVEPWADWQVEKLAEVYGTVQATDDPDVFRVANGRHRLVNLADQLGQPVRLRGRLWDRNREWYFRYRGIDLFVEMKVELPTRRELYADPWAAVEIAGTLEMEKLPNVDQYLLRRKENRDLV